MVLAQVAIAAAADGAGGKVVLAAGGSDGTIMSPQGVPSVSCSLAAVSEAASAAGGWCVLLSAAAARLASGNRVPIKSPRALDTVNGDEHPVVSARGLPLLPVLAPSSALTRPAAVVGLCETDGALAAVAPAAASVAPPAAAPTALSAPQASAALPAGSSPDGSGGGGGSWRRSRSAIT